MLEKLTERVDREVPEGREVQGRPQAVRGGAEESGPPIEQVAMLHRLLKLTNRLMAPFSAHLEKQYRITLNEFRLLMTIGRHGESASHELATRTGVNVMSVSRAVSTLEKRGWISVSRDPENRRRKTLRLTDEGRRLYAVMRPQSAKVADYLFGGLPGEDLAAFDRMLQMMTERLESRDEQGRSRFLEETRPLEGTD